MRSRGLLVLLGSIVALGLTLAWVVRRAAPAAVASTEPKPTYEAPRPDAAGLDPRPPTRPAIVSRGAPRTAQRAEVRSDETGTTSGVVVDARTGEPVADLWVRLTCAEPVGRLERRTDERGRFETPSPWAAEPKLRLFDLPAELSVPDERLHAEHAVACSVEPDGPGAMRVRAEIGPTQCFVPRGPVDASCRAPGHVLARLVDPASDGASSWTFARRVDGVWVARFRQPLVDRFDGTGTFLETAFVSANGAEEASSVNRAAHPTGDAPLRYTGRHPVAGLVGIQPGVLSIAVALELGLEVRVLDAAQRPLEDVQVCCVGLDPEVEGPTTWIGQTRSSGTVRAFPLRPGAYRIVAQSRRHRVGAIRFDARPGRQRAPDLVLEPLPVGGTIEGHVEILGELDGHLAVARLRGLGSHRYEAADVVGLEGRSSSGGFSFEDVPEGEYEVSLICVPELPAQPARVSVTAPGEFVFRVSAADQGPTVGFAAHDARTGEAIDEVDVLLEVGGRTIPEALEFDFGDAPWRLPHDRAMRWWMGAEGYRPLAGDRSAFPARGDPRIARVRLEPGYGLRILLRDATSFLETYHEGDLDEALAVWSAPPVADVRVLADGVPVATSDARGLATVSLSTAPRRLELAAPGWRVFGENPLDGGRVPDDTPVVVWLSR